MEDLTKHQLIVLVILVSFVSSLFTGIVTISLMNQAPSPITQTIQKVIERSASLENSQEPLKKEETQELEVGALSRDVLIGDIVNRVSPAVVSVIATKDIPVVSLGTGFFVSENGLLITNKHVVADREKEYSIVTNDGKTIPAKVIARDLLHDVAVLKVESSQFAYIPLGNSDFIKIGQTAIVIGNALGEFQNTVSIGVISGLKRNITVFGSGAGIEQLTDVIQTDAVINFGNSGGPILNLKGEAIGLNTAVAQGAQNIGFAVPINQIKKGIEDVKKNGRIIYPFLGVRYTMTEKGAVLSKGPNEEPAVVDGSPAYKTGLKEKDIILEFGGKKVDGNIPLTKLIQERQVGEVLNIKILRDGAEIILQTTLQERKE